MAKITTITLAYNEEHDIERCLNSLQWADERIVMDSCSSDSTISKARPLCTRVIQKRMRDFSSIRNDGIEEASNKWILMVDADEVIPQELADEIIEAIKENKFEGYRINRINYMYGIKLSYDQPDYQLRLFKKSKTVYKNKVHEEAVIDGETSKLKNSFIHYSMKNLDEHINKMNRYTDLASSEKEAHILKLFLKPFYRFIQVLLLKRSYRDGVVGIILSLNAFFYEFLILFKVWERRYIRNDWNRFYESIDIEEEVKKQEHIHKELIDSIRSESPGSILEVGSGAASIAFSILKGKKIRFVTVDNNIDILKKIRSNAKKLGLHIDVVCADAFKLPFKQGAFDTTFSQGLLEHFNDKNISELIKEKLRVASNSVLFSVPNNYYKHKDFGDEKLLSKARWEKVLSGFNIAESKNYYTIRTKRNFLKSLPIMYMCKIKSNR